MKSKPSPVRVGTLCPIGLLGLLLLPATVIAADSSTNPVEQLYGSLSELEAAHKHYQKLASDEAWTALDVAEVLTIGSSAASVAALRERLAAEGYDVSAEGETYDQELAAVVETFQRRNGLEVDGKVGPATVAALNRSPAQRAGQIAATLERRRAQEPRDTTSTYILVNLPEQRLHAFDSSKEQLTMDVVIGTPDWPTPELREELETIVVNPYWYVPIEIIAADLASELGADPKALERKNMEIVEEPGPNAEPIAAPDIDWSSVRADDPESFPYLLRQKPGPENPLGRIKFLMPNDEDIYLHDTPEKHLFDDPERDISHGCIRLENALELAELLAQASGLSRAKVEEAIAAGRHEQAALEQPVPVDLVYWTAWVGEEGEVHFREDVYSRDGG